MSLFSTLRKCTRFMALRFSYRSACLRLLTEHAFLFKEYLTEDADRLFATLTHLCKHQNVDVHRAAFRAIDAFLHHVANELVSDARSTASNHATFKVRGLAVS